MKNYKLAILSMGTLLMSFSAFANDCDWIRQPNLREACDSTYATEEHLMRAKEFHRGNSEVERKCDFAIEKARETRRAIHEAARMAR